MCAQSSQCGTQGVVVDPDHVSLHGSQFRRCRRFTPLTNYLNAFDRTLFEAQPPDAAPPEMRIDPGQHLIRLMLQFEREAALDTDDQGGRLRRSIGLPARWPRRPLQFDRSRVGREALSYDIVPVENEVGFGEALSGQDRIDDRADEIGERLRPLAFAGRFGHGGED
jgi:hypothetical protein